MLSRRADVASLGVCVLEEGGDVVSLYSALTSLVIRLLFCSLTYNCLPKHTKQCTFCTPKRQDQGQITVECV